MLTGDTVSQWRVIGPAEPMPTHGHAHVVALGGVELLLDDAGERLEVGLRADVLVDEHDGAVEQLAARRDQAGGELGAADVDGEHDRRQLAGGGAASVGVVGSGSSAVVWMRVIRSSCSFVSKRSLGRARVRP